MRIRLIFLGRTRGAELLALMEDYLGRIRHYTEIETTVLQGTSRAVASRLKIDPNATVVLLDADGKQYTSSGFARWLGDLRDRGRREVVFLCGDASGFPEALRNVANQKLALSTFTMPHDLARVVLVEQLYRAFAILAGHPYPR